MRFFFLFFFFYSCLSPPAWFSSPDQTEMGVVGMGTGRHWVPRSWCQCWWGRIDNYRVGRAHYQAAAVRPAALAGKRDGLDLRGPHGANTGWLTS